MRQHRTHNYIFVVNNWTEEERDAIRTLLRSDSVVRGAFGYERGDGGTNHIQGIVSFKEALSFKSAKKAIGTRAHVETMVADYPTNEDYVFKRGEFTDKEHTRVPGTEVEVFGKAWARGRRTDLLHYVQAVRAGADDQELFSEYPGTHLRYGRLAGIVRAANRRHARNRPKDRRERQPKRVVVYWGDSGTGKSHQAWSDMEGRGDVFQYLCSDGRRAWFDGYEGTMRSFHW